MLKQGTKLVNKETEHKYHIGGVCGEVYLIVSDDNDVARVPLTHSELLAAFTVIEEEWQPEMLEYYYFLGDNGGIGVTQWQNDSFDIFRRDNLGIYKTHEEVPTSYKFKK